ncbi:MAG: hypothetical protein IT328_20110 [Caldilineaceae bacterium]|nr:hypothetical protein [Caldilineaceae bacterium]
MRQQRSALGNALQRLQLSILRAQLHVRQVTLREQQLQREWATTIDPLLSDLYWEPLGRLQEAPEDEGDLREWLLLLLMGGWARRRLSDNLGSYLLRSADVGGEMALAFLDVDGGFHLSAPDYLAVINARRDELLTASAELSLLDTTAEQLTQAIVRAREESNPLPYLAPLVSSWVATRRNSITITEMAWAVAAALTWTYLNNAVEEQMFTARADACALCLPKHGVVVRTNNVPLGYGIPQHTGCRCIWMPVTRNWTEPANIWRGGRVT